MRKITLAAIMALFSFTSVSAGPGINVGVSGHIGLFTASAKEVADETHSGSEHGEAAWSSLFIEKTLGDRLAIGIDYVPDALESETTESTKHDITTSTAATSKTNKVQIDFEDLTTYYLALNVTDNLYFKVGSVTVDVITNESLGTGSEYGNTDLDGTMWGVGYNKSFDNTTFIRFEGNYMAFDGTSLSSADNKITLKNLDGVSGKLSIGKSF